MRPTAGALTCLRSASLRRDHVGSTSPGSAGTYKPLAWNHLGIVGTPGNNYPPFRKGGGLAALDARNGRRCLAEDFHAGGGLFQSQRVPRSLYPAAVNLHHRLAALPRSWTLASGEELAVFAAPGEAEGWSYLGAQNDRLYGVSRDGRTVFCVDRSSGAKVWCCSAGGRVFIPALSAGRLFLQTH